MPDPRAQWFVIDDRQDRWWLYRDDPEPLYSSMDAEPLPAEPGREKASHARRLAVRLRMVIRPRERGLRWSPWKPSRG